jgi:hypothetical protein
MKNKLYKNHTNNQYMTQKHFGQCETKGGTLRKFFEKFFISYDFDIELNRFAMVGLVGKISISAHNNTIKPKLWSFKNLGLKCLNPLKYGLR